ncbi:MAG: nucleotidyl transferase AbiEii/AbiGii toxin family protein [Candidatus Wenzhouxiangella sp. M2_3B_020]
MFERPHHQRIAYLLGLLDSELLRACKCWFGGGTAIVLRFGEYRESRDIDFLVSDAEGYRALRRRLTGRTGMGEVFSATPDAIPASKPVRADRYGIRTRFEVAGAEIKFEIVNEGHIELETPSATDTICGVTALTSVDMAATKLMANADRWADDGTFNRDLLDLAMMELSRADMRQARNKAREAYGDSIDRGLGRSIERLQQREGWMERCMDMLQFRLPRAVVWDRIRRLQRRLEEG